ncbi:MAG: hypothetical protein WKF66_16880 [Pedobacter sp.]
MTLTKAFQELIAANLDWHKLTAMSKEDGKLFSDAFIQSGTNPNEVRKVLGAAGYVITETWSKGSSPKVQQDIPKTGIITDDSQGS